MIEGINRLATSDLTVCRLVMIERITYTTICFRPRSGFRTNLRVRSVTGCSRSAMMMDLRGQINRFEFRICVIE